MNPEWTVALLQDVLGVSATCQTRWTVKNSWLHRGLCTDCRSAGPPGLCLLVRGLLALRHADSLGAIVRQIVSITG